MPINFWSPVYSGKRFEDHTIPLELLEDLSILQSLLIEIAKDIYYEENDKERVPNGFTEGVNLKLSTITEGSSVSNIVLSIATAGTMAITTKQIYYEKAKDRIIQYIAAINKPQSSTSNLNEEHLYLIHRLGKNLLDDESLDLSPKSEVYIAKLDKKTRSWVDNRLKTKYQEPFEIIGQIPNIDKSKNNFILETKSTKVSCVYDESIFTNILLAFNGYHEGVKVRLKGYGIFNQEYKLTGLKSITDVLVIPSVNINKRLDSFKELKENWLDGNGKSISSEFLDWIKDAIASHLDFDIIQAPKIYPTPDGGVQLEWTSLTFDVSLEIYSNKKGNLHIADLTGKSKTIEVELDFNIPDNWNIVAQYILRYF